MSDLQTELEMDEQEELLQEDYDPQRFYRALSNALSQLKHFQAAEAA